MAGIGGYKVISVDYRMPPDAPYPAAMDDATAVWKAMLALQKPQTMGVFGTSTGGGMTLALMLRAKQEGLALPAAIGLGTPWSDMTETGDTYRTNEWLDNVLVSYSGYLTPAAKLYAAGRDLKDPQLSPINGDFAGLPPADPDQRDPRPVPVEHGAHPPEVACGRDRGGSPGVRGDVARPVSRRAERAGDQGGLRRDGPVPGRASGPLRGRARHLVMERVLPMLQCSISENALHFPNGPPSLGRSRAGPTRLDLRSPSVQTYTWPSPTASCSPACPTTPTSRPRSRTPPRPITASA